MNQIKSKQICVNEIILPHFMAKIFITFSIQLTSAQKWGYANVSMYVAHCFVSSNSFHRQITQKAVHQITDPEKKM